jgi:hypothetical protein
MSAGQPILFVLTSGLNTGLAALAITIISNIYLSRHLGKMRLYVKINGKKKTLVVPMNIHKLSYAQRQLDKHTSTSINRLGYENGHVLIELK